MKLATYRYRGTEHCGVVDGGRVHPLRGSRMLDVVSIGLDRALELGHRATRATGLPLQDVRLLAPLRPPSMRDFVAFEEHVAGVRRSIDHATGVPDAWYDAPTFYFTNPHTVLGPDDDVAFPAACELRDFELEVAVVIGREGRSVRAEDARGHVFGYTLLNDWSARDLQSREMQFGLCPSKGKDFASTLGPWIVTADELEHSRDGDGFLTLWCAASVNGVEVGRDLLSNMGWTFESLISQASRDARIVPGDVLGSGTVGNGGCLAELWGRHGRQDPPPLQPDDVVTLTVEGIGSLSNRVTRAAAVPGVVPPRRRSPSDARALATRG